MAFSIPNASVASSARLAEPDSGDVAVIVAAAENTGVLTGCAVTAQGAPDMTVAVAAGEVMVLGVPAVVTAGNLTVTAAHATNPRLDLVVVSAAGAKSVVAGSPNVNPEYPAIPASSVVLAAIDVPATDITIAANQIIDKRMVINGDPLRAGRAKSVGTTYYSVPGVELNSVSTQVLTANIVRYEPFFVESAIVLDTLAVEVSTLATGTARLGIYRANRDFQPTDLILDAGTVSTSTTGVKTIAVSVTLQPGWYLFALNSDAGAALRRLIGGTVGIQPAMGTSPFITQFTATQTYAAFPATGLAWDTSVASATAGISHLVLCRILTP